MKYTTRIVKNGGSLYAILPSIVKRNLDIDEGDDVEIEVSKVNNQKVLEKYRCKMCGLLFESDDDVPYCPSCDNENVEKMYVEIN